MSRRTKQTRRDGERAREEGEKVEGEGGGEGAEYKEKCWGKREESVVVYSGKNLGEEAVAGKREEREGW